MGVLRGWKCMNCAMLGRADTGGFDFDGEHPVCPQCGIDGRNVALKHHLVPRVTIHFDPPTGAVGIGKRVLACRPGYSIRANPDKLHATGEAWLVTCPLCKATADYQAAPKDSPRRRDDEYGEDNVIPALPVPAAASPTAAGVQHWEI